MMLKPDAVQRGLIGQLMTRFEQRGLCFTAIKMIRLSPEMAGRHYAEHEGKPFYPGLIAFITSGPVVATVIQGPDAVAAVRQTLGLTKPLASPTGSIRGDFALSTGRNLVHASANMNDAEREIALFFSPSEIVTYERELDRWIVE